MLTSIPCVVMRGGTSRGLYFHARDLPADRALRDRVLLAAMGSPHGRQIDGMGGAHPLTSKIAVISPASRRDADVDYLFLQVAVDRGEVSDSQNCGNILAGVGPFAIEQALVECQPAQTPVRIHMVNSGSLATTTVLTPHGRVEYEGSARIDGVPGTAAPVAIDFLDLAGGSCGHLLPTGSPRNTVDGTELTCVDNGMPVVLLRAADLGTSGYESPAELEADGQLKQRIERIRLTVGSMMKLGDVTSKTVPKMCLIAPPANGGAVSTRTFIPHRVHESIGVLGAISVATACALPGSVAEGITGVRQSAGPQEIDVEHPTGFFSVTLELSIVDGSVRVDRSALLRTARKLMSGEVHIPSSIWSGP